MGACSASWFQTPLSRALSTQPGSGPLPPAAGYLRRTVGLKGASFLSVWVSVFHRASTATAGMGAASLTSSWSMGKLGGTSGTRIVPSSTPGIGRPPRIRMGSSGWFEMSTGGVQLMSSRVLQWPVRSPPPQSSAGALSTNALEGSITAVSVTWPFCPLATARSIQPIFRSASFSSAPSRVVTSLSALEETKTNWISSRSKIPQRSGVPRQPSWASTPSFSPRW